VSQLAIGLEVKADSQNEHRHHGQTSHAARAWRETDSAFERAGQVGLTNVRPPTVAELISPRRTNIADEKDER